MAGGDLKVPPCDRQRAGMAARRAKGGPGFFTAVGGDLDVIAVELLLRGPWSAGVRATRSRGRRLDVDVLLKALEALKMAGVPLIDGNALRAERIIHKALNKDKRTNGTGRNIFRRLMAAKKKLTAPAVYPLPTRGSRGNG